MILQVQPIYDCLKKIKALKNQKTKNKVKIILMDPAGKKFDQRMAEKFSKLDRVVLICGRYEGFDARIHKLVDERISVGDYVLAGGELPALTIVEAVSRLIPGVLGNEESLKEETFGQGVRKKESSFAKATAGKQVSGSNDKLPATSYKLKEYPQYTRPENFMGQKVPKVLLGGDHKKIEEWRKKKSK
jgi:tRNA (guanine37-N1)-methyltransferase